MTTTIRFDPEALFQLDELDTWWRFNRRSAANQVTDEVERICAVLEETPDLGTPYPHETVADVRVMRLHKTPYRLYYKHDQDTDEIIVLALWSTMRKHGPPLGP